MYQIFTLELNVETRLFIAKVARYVFVIHVTIDRYVSEHFDCFHVFRLGFDRLYRRAK